MLVPHDNLQFMLRAVLQATAGAFHNLNFHQWGQQFSGNPSRFTHIHTHTVVNTNKYKHHHFPFKYFFFFLVMNKQQPHGLS